MRTDYAAAITESEEELPRLERVLRGRRQHARVRMLRLLKGGRPACPGACRWWGIACAS